MKRHLFKRILRILLIVLSVLVVVIGYFVYRFTTPLSDSQINSKFNKSGTFSKVEHLSFKGRQVRVILMQEKTDTLLPTLVFVHGSPGSAMDFERYLKDPELNAMANLISYDRIGYGPEARGEVLGSLGEEVELLHEILSGTKTDRIVLVGYSYGGTVVMASERPYKKKIVLAAAVRGDLEPVFWALNLYTWKLTRPMVPKVFQGASIEKFRHLSELPAYTDKWNLSPSRVLSIHGEGDRIVPFENSLFLKRILDEGKFRLIPLAEGNHSLIWTNFDVIKNELIKTIEE